MTIIGIPLALEHHFFPHISISANPDYVATGKPLPTGVVSAKLNVSEADKTKNRFMAELHVSTQAAPEHGLPYSLDILCVCYATIKGELPEGVEARAVIADVGNQVLFPAVRELVLSLTARQPWGQFSIGVAVFGPGRIPSTTKPQSKPRKALEGPSKSARKSPRVGTGAKPASTRTKS